MSSLRFSVKFGMANLGSILAGSNSEGLIRAEVMAWQHMADLFRHIVTHRDEKELRQAVQQMMYQRAGVVAILASRSGQIINCRMIVRPE